MKNITPEMIEKAKAAKTAAELLALAKDNGVEMTADEAATYFAQLSPKSGEISDDELDSVAGGACQSKEKPFEKKVRVTSGQTCKCGTNIGILKPYGQYAFDYVLCEPCDYVIGFDNGMNFSYEVIE